MPSSSNSVGMVLNSYNVDHSVLANGLLEYRRYISFSSKGIVTVSVLGLEWTIQTEKMPTRDKTGQIKVPGFGSFASQTREIIVTIKHSRHNILSKCEVVGILADSDLISLIAYKLIALKFPAMESSPLDNCFTGIFSHVELIQNIKETDAKELKIKDLQDKIDDMTSDTAKEKAYDRFIKEFEGKLVGELHDLINVIKEEHGTISDLINDDSTL